MRRRARARCISPWAVACKMPKRSKRAKVNDEPIILVDNPMKAIFTASCDIEPSGCAFAWLLLLLSVVAHTMHYCGGDECKTDDDEPNTMYS